ncbi:exosortase F system-associated membrane protein [Polaribacter gochangensis]|uniref:exosortase F system-associated membrane protein n=1 Tax=Polaribacter gochangensis TaxID=3252903 RepID=UPI003904A3DE
MKKGFKYISIIILIALFFLIRAFENDLFYDPLITYFENDYLYSSMPEVNTWKLVVDLLFRYTLNSLITLCIIYIAFDKKRFVKFAGFFLMLAFIILIVAFVFLLKGEFRQGYLLPFYVRRFLIHPLFLLLLFPAFYYMKLNKLRRF